MINNHIQAYINTHTIIKNKITKNRAVTTKVYLFLQKPHNSPPLCLVDIDEVLRLFQALQWVVDLGFGNMDFSLYLKVVVDAFNSNNNNSNEFGSIIQTCMQLFSGSFNNFMVEFSTRQANGVAHELTQEALL